MKRTLATLFSTMATSLSAKTQHIGWSKLATAWSPQLAVVRQQHKNDVVQRAVARTLPLLTDSGSVPFVCRYRTDVIAPLQVEQIHQLADWLAKHESLQTLRHKLLQQPAVSSDDSLKLRVETSHSKAELDDLYAPFKQPSKGSLEDRIRQEHPALIEAVDNLFYQGHRIDVQLRPKEAAVTLLANRMASHPAVMDALMETQQHCCIVKLEKAKDDQAKYSVYYDMERPVHALRDHQVLAMKRGAEQKALKLALSMDAEKAQSTMTWALRDKSPPRGSSNSSLWKDAIHDAWTRLLRKRFTTRVWREKCAVATTRAVQVFCDNLYKALLAPPPATPRPLLALDPGFKAGIKCALLHADGRVEDLVTVQFMPHKKRGLEQVQNLLQKLKEMGDTNHPLCVVVGNGHGTQEAQQLVHQAAQGSGMDVEIQLVNEAGASVWSVAPQAAKEFPDQPAAAIAAVSIGRRYLNPLAELVKIPPRSLGLGMYQHDVSEKELDEKLHLTSVDAVAEVGVDVNSGSLEILCKVPGLTEQLGVRILNHRPLASRRALLEISGLGPKTFENCA